MQSIGHVTLLVRGYDEAIEYFMRALDFRVIQDEPVPEGKRWVLVAACWTSRLLTESPGLP